MIEAKIHTKNELSELEMKSNALQILVSTTYKKQSLNQNLETFSHLKELFYSTWGNGSRSGCYFAGYHETQFRKELKVRIIKFRTYVRKKLISHQMNNDANYKKVYAHLHQLYVFECPLPETYLLRVLNALEEELNKIAPFTKKKQKEMLLRMIGGIKYMSKNDSKIEIKAIQTLIENRVTKKVNISRWCDAKRLIPETIAVNNKIKSLWDT